MACRSPQLGGNSLQAGAVCARVRAALALKHTIPVTWIMQNQTVQTLAAKLSESAQQQLPKMPALQPTVSLRTDGDITAPLSFQQVWFLHEAEHALGLQNSSFPLKKAVIAIVDAGAVPSWMLYTRGAGNVLPAVAARTQLRRIQFRLCKRHARASGHRLPPDSVPAPGQPPAGERHFGRVECFHIACGLIEPSIDPASHVLVPLRETVHLI